MIISVDDGCASDIRLAELCKKYGIDLVIYLPVEWHSIAHYKGYKPLHYDDVKLLSREFEIGSHTITHRHLTDLDPNDWGREIKESKKMLDKLFDINVTKFCPPRGYTNEDITDYTFRVYKSQRLTKGEGLVHIHPESGANDKKHWLECIDKNTEELWCHSWELDRFPEEWSNLEKYLERTFA